MANSADKRDLKTFLELLKMESPSFAPIKYSVRSRFRLKNNDHSFSIFAMALRAWLVCAIVVQTVVAGNPDAKRLYDDLLSNYNKLVRPVVNVTDVLRVCIKLKLSQLIDVVRNTNLFTSSVHLPVRDFSQLIQLIIASKTVDARAEVASHW